MIFSLSKFCITKYCNSVIKKDTEDVMTTNGDNELQLYVCLWRSLCVAMA